MKSTISIFLMLLLIFTTNSSFANVIYKCRSQDGVVNYSQQPCGSGETLIKSRDLSKRLGNNAAKNQKRLDKIVKRKNERIRKRQQRRQQRSNHNSHSRSTDNINSSSSSSSHEISTDSSGEAVNTNSVEASQQPSNTTPPLQQAAATQSEPDPKRSEPSQPKRSDVSQPQPEPPQPDPDPETPTESYNPNQPDGFNLITDYNFSFFDNTWWKRNDQLQNFSFQQSLTAPSSPSSFGRIRYPAGHPGGYEPYKMGITGFDYRQIYLSFTFRVSENWQNHPSGVNKLGFIVHDETGGGGDPCYINMNSTGNGRYVEIRKQGPSGARNLTPNLADVEIILGQWYLVEVLLDANGTAHLWVNGVKTTEYTDVNWGSPGFDEYKLDPTWGGNTGPTVNHDMYLDVDHVYLSGK